MIRIDEKHLEDIIYDALCSKEGAKNLSEKGLNLIRCDTWLLRRQANLRDYGVADIIKIGMSKGFISINIIELKVVKFSFDHLTQLGRYMSCVNDIMEHSSIHSYKYEVLGTLIVSEFDTESDLTWIDRVISKNIIIYNTDYDLNGLRFNKVIPYGWRYKGASSDLSEYDMASRDYRTLYKHACNVKPQ